MSGKKLLVIGISGATCSGKTTVTDLLTKCFGAVKFNQDDFYHREDHPAHIKVPGFNHLNWEVESAFDNKKLFKAVDELLLHSAKKVESTSENCKILNLRRALDSTTLESLITSKAELSPFAVELFQSVHLPILLLEGITIFECVPLRDICDLRLFFTLDEATCKKRRIQRVYDPPDPPGYFEAAVWPTFVSHLDSLRKQKNLCIHYIDGRNPLEANFITAAKLIIDLSLQ